MKNYLLAAAAVAAFALSNSTAFAACADEIRLQESRMITSNTNQNAQNTESLKPSAFALLTEAKTLCTQGNESGAINVLDHLKSLLTSMGW